jgi:hypothetical protein
VREVLARAKGRRRREGGINLADRLLGLRFDVSAKIYTAPMGHTISAAVPTEWGTHHPISQSGTVSFLALASSSRAVTGARSKSAEFGFTGGDRGRCESEHRAAHPTTHASQAFLANALMKCPAIPVGGFLLFVRVNSATVSLLVLFWANLPNPRTPLPV